MVIRTRKENKLQAENWTQLSLLLLESKLQFDAILCLIVRPSQRCCDAFCLIDSVLFQEAQTVFNDMLKAGVRPDVRSYTVLMDAYGRAGLCNHMQRILAEMEGSGFVPDSVTYFVLVRAFTNAERWNDGLQYYRLMCQQTNLGAEISQDLISEYQTEYEFLLQLNKEGVKG